MAIGIAIIAIGMMAIWVDDGLLCSSWISKLNDIVHFLSENLEMTSGPVGVFVGIQIYKADKKNLFISLKCGT